MAVAVRRERKAGSGFELSIAKAEHDVVRAAGLLPGAIGGALICLLGGELNFAAGYINYCSLPAYI